MGRHQQRQLDRARRAIWVRRKGVTLQNSRFDAR